MSSDWEKYLDKLCEKHKVSREEGANFALSKEVKKMYDERERTTIQNDRNLV